MDDYIFINKDDFIFLDHNYGECCKNIVDKDTINFIYPYHDFISDLLDDNSLKEVFNQCKIDFKRSNVYLNKEKITFNQFLRYIKSKYDFKGIKKSLVFISQSLYGKIVTEIGLGLCPDFIGELDREQKGIYFNINNDMFKAEKILRIFGINSDGNCYTIKKIKITLYCNIVIDEFINIDIETV